MQTLADRVRTQRKRLGLSQGELARRAWLDQSLLSRIESGATTNPGVNAMKGLARALHVSIDHLVGMYDEDPRPLVGATP